MENTNGLQEVASLITLAIEAKTTGNEKPMYQFLKTLDTSTLQEASICLAHTIASLWSSLESWQAALTTFWNQGNQ